MQKIVFFACSCLSCQQLAINGLLSQQLFFTDVHYRDANACCRNDAARL